MGLVPQYVIGPEGISRPYTCACDGLVRIERLDDSSIPIAPNAPNPFGNVIGNCDDVWRNIFRVTVETCAPPFAANSAGPVEVDARNQLGTTVLAEADALHMDMRRLLQPYAGCGVKIAKVGNRIVNGCARWSVDIVWLYQPCDEGCC